MSDAKSKKNFSNVRFLKSNNTNLLEVEKRKGSQYFSMAN